MLASFRFRFVTLAVNLPFFRPSINVATNAVNRVRGTLLPLLIVIIEGLEPLSTLDLVALLLRALDDVLADRAVAALLLNRLV